MNRIRYRSKNSCIFFLDSRYDLSTKTYVNCLSRSRGGGVSWALYRLQRDKTDKRINHTENITSPGDVIWAKGHECKRISSQSAASTFLTTRSSTQRHGEHNQPLSGHLFIHFIFNPLNCLLYCENLHAACFFSCLFPLTYSRAPNEPRSYQRIKSSDIICILVHFSMHHWSRAVLG